MQILKFIGNSSAFSDSTNNCSFYKVDNYLLLLDCGEDVFKKIKKSNLLEGITIVDIWISHLHGDHAGSLSTFIFYCYYNYGITPNVIRSNEFNDLDTYLKITGCINNCKVKEFYNNKTSHDYIEAIYNISHSCDIKSFSILLNIKNKKIFYSGDCNELPCEILRLFKLGMIDQLYIDCCNADYPGNVHMNVDKLYSLLNGQYNDKVYCMHLDSKNLYEKVKKYNFNVVNIENLY